VIAEQFVGLALEDCQQKKQVVLYKYSDSLTLSSFPVAFCVIDGSPRKERKGKQKLNEIYPLFRDMTSMTQLRDLEFCEVCFLV
jgi:hypothetical protein